MDMKKSTHKLLEKANSVIARTTGIDVPKKEKDISKKEVRAIYKKIKETDPEVYKVIMGGKV